jgi:NAD(P)-dependent dehydrogenase (short-subunit alcohol dehydrogenase family)
MGKNTNPFDLTGKSIVVTGASSGIGRQCAITCSESGARVILMGRNIDRLHETLSQMTGNNHIVSPVNLLDYNEVERSIKLSIDQSGKVSGLINCAGISITLPFSQTTPDRMDNFFKSNVIGAMNLTRLIVKKDNFSEDGGSIIFISSVMGCAGENGKSLYSITKGAINAGVRSIAIELARKKIRVNSVSPGVVETPMSINAVYNRDEVSLEKIKSLHPLGLGTPDDIANACIFLLSDAARWITGTNIIVDGGYLAK